VAQFGALGVVADTGNHRLRLLTCALALLFRPPGIMGRASRSE
jgi:hypothetical protein